MNQELEQRGSHLKRSQSKDIIKYTLENFIMNKVRYPSVQELLDSINRLVSDDLENNQFSRGYIYGFLKAENITTKTGNDAMKELALKLGIDTDNAIIIDGEIHTNNPNVMSSAENSIKRMSTDSLKALMASIVLELSERSNESDAIIDSD